MNTWNLFKYWKRQHCITKQTISNPTFIVTNPEEIHGEIATKKKIIDAKSEKNLASLEEIKTTLLKWKDENDKIFNHYETEKEFFSPKKISKNEMSQSFSFDSHENLEDRVLAWRERNHLSTVINESDSCDSDDTERNYINVRFRNPCHQEALKRPERSNSFRALGKALKKGGADNSKSDYF
ncbi:hypothetical protein LOD99_3649 [Oopsacas minuta]|uniref:Uncharacterized protein n=1 Tax=Oopsacas minuta TaxID=111878 RepID=A0AAV7JXB6_9METZ|nr:hypothetical protein LOD99_3649 [Oopsacas minuta]